MTQVGVVRRATSTDVGEIIEALKAFHTEMNFDFPKDVSRVTRVLFATMRLNNWVCFVCGEPISGVLLASADESMFGPVRFAAEKAFWVAPQERKLGYGKLLIEALEAWALEQKCDMVCLTAQTNTEGRSKVFERWVKGMNYSERELTFAKDLRSRSRT